ncbi:hypothetical protein BDN70DRAFT_873642 [Pholiota conissans]|uniref:Mitochondrial K+-H+ exchange-related-domain-containing protein n=1 Tax=Pholiota conissans TaxID=109636 RepID=A0A9P5Z8T3_9AGAR|nr:hypothetical protein BDN70DRAFT_873642 [Pholiota conissans]
MALKSLQKMRIIALPLTRPLGTPAPSISQLSTSGSGLDRLTYYQLQISGKKKRVVEEDRSKEASGEETKKGFRAWPAQIRTQGLSEWTTHKAAEVWSGFGQAKGGWKRWVHDAGEKLVDRMEFEELALKSVDPSMGPSIVNLARSGKAVLEDGKEVPVPKIPLVFPPSQVSPEQALAELRAYTRHRIPRHRKGFYVWMGLAPLMTPFMLIPIIPNLPFFFCVWRSWSHYRAYKASEYLELLLAHDIILPTPSAPLDEIYRVPTIQAPAQSYPVSQSSSSSLSSPSPPHTSTSGTEANQLLLTRNAVPSILSIFGFAPESTAAVDMYRAVDQAKVRVESGRLGI